MFAVFTVTGAGPMEWLEIVPSIEEFKIRHEDGVYAEHNLEPSFVFVLPCAAFVDIDSGQPVEYASAT